MAILSLVLLVSVFSIRSIRSQEQSVSVTQLEEFSATTGAVIIKGYQELGTVFTDHSTPELFSYEEISVNCMELTNGRTGEKLFGVTIDVTATLIKNPGLGAPHVDSNRSFIDYDEVQALLEGIDYIAKATLEEFDYIAKASATPSASATPLKRFEATYLTRGDLRLTAFSDDKGRVFVTVASGKIGGAIAYINLEQLVVRCS